MTFIFDCRFIRVDHHDGISRFSSELFAAVSKKTKVLALICSVDQLGALPQGTDYLLANDPKNPLAELFLPRRLNKQDASVVFSPMQTMGSLGKKYKLVLTLHDLIYYKHRTPPASLGWPIRLAWWLFHMSFTPVRILLNRADAVVTISQTTKALIEANRLTRKPIHVILNSASMTVADSAKTQPRSRNLLYMGSFMKYKNVETLVMAMNFLPEYTLTLCSKIQPGRKSELLRMASESTSPRINFMNGVSESDYLNLLDESFALVSASKDEGFGIPVIEAMSRAVPIVVSEIPIFREITAGKGEFFDAESPDSLAQAIRRLEPIDSWQHASQKSLDQSKLFSWEDSAKKLLRVVESLRG